MSDGRIYRAEISPEYTPVYDGSLEICFGDTKVATIDMNPRLCELQDGDVVYLSASDKQYKVGDKYDDNEHLIISKVVRYKRPWWKFWVKRKVVGYKIRYVR